MPSRFNIIETIGKPYLTTNIENDEFSYQKAFKAKPSIKFEDISISGKEKRTYKNIDLRFVSDKDTLTILVETKQNFDNDLESAKEQLSAYVSYENKLTGNKVIAILANTTDDRVIVWKTNITDENLLKKETRLKGFNEFLELYFPKITNNREEVMRNTYTLNELLHTHGVKEKLRGQFVGTCLLGIKHNLLYKGLPTRQIIAGLRGILEKLLSNNLNKAEKLAILGNKVLDDQDIRELKDAEFEEILDFVRLKIYPFINDKSTQGQDLLNLFFTTFNKYVGKADKNQAFTPDHIVDFMCKAIGINKNSIVLDPCCGSGSFLVRAMTMALDDCDNEAEKDAVKLSHIYGIEADDVAFGLSTTNMLIHGDGNSNVYQASCFERLKDIASWNIDRVLMNPPYNAQPKRCKSGYVETWDSKKKEDPSKGFHFVYEVAKVVKKGKLAVLLPMQCAIGSDKEKEIKKFKQLMLQEHHLDAVFSLPPDIFHPGASANACCMIFDLGIKHESAPIKETFFGYFKDDGFVKRKFLGRVEKKQGIWKEKEKLWLDLYMHKKVVRGISAVKEVTYKDEWLAEAYMDTDYSKISVEDFETTIRNYLAYLIQNRSE